MIYLPLVYNSKKYFIYSLINLKTSIMPIPNRTRDNNGQFREKRSDTLVKNLKNDYPIFNNINGNTKLGTLKQKFNTPSLDGVMKALRKNHQ
jgi:hypothetical protein